VGETAPWIQSIVVAAGENRTYKGPPGDVRSRPCLIPANTPVALAGYRHRLASASSTRALAAGNQGELGSPCPDRSSLLSSIAAKAGSTHAASASGSQRVMLSGAGATAPSPTKRLREARLAIKPQGRQQSDAGHNDPLRRCKIRHIGIDTVVAYALVFFGSGQLTVVFSPESSIPCPPRCR